MKMQMLVKLIVVSGSVLIVSACSIGNMDELKGFVNEVKSRTPSPIKPLPEIKQVETYTYEANDRRSPFFPVKEQEKEEEIEYKDNGIKPDAFRRKEELEQYALDSLRMVGTLSQKDDMWGLIVNSDGVIYQVKLSEYMGENHGQIIRITEDSIDLMEIVPDPQGGFRERQASIALSEGGE